jgi:threonine aldolase
MKEGHINLYSDTQTRPTLAMRQAIRTKDRYAPRPSLVVVEQTANLGSGAVWPLEDIRDVAEVAKSHGLALHMDGARLLNAVVAAGVSARQYAKLFDSVWIDLSKGLGCPVGAVLAGSSGFFEEAWRWKQRIGGAVKLRGRHGLALLARFRYNASQQATHWPGPRDKENTVGGPCHAVSSPGRTVALCPQRVRPLPRRSFR